MQIRIRQAIIEGRTIVGHRVATATLVRRSPWCWWLRSMDVRWQR